MGTPIIAAAPELARSPGQRRLGAWAERWEEIYPDLEVIRDRAPLGVPLAVLFLLGIATAVALDAPLSQALASRPASAAAFAHFAVWISALVSPLVALAKAVLYATIVWAVAALFDDTLRFRPVISLFLYGEVVVSLWGPFTVAALYLRGLGTLTSPGNLLVPAGIDLFVDISHAPVLAAVAHTTTIFHVLWFILVAFGLSRVTSMSRRAALAGAATLWAGVVLTGVIRALLFT